MSQLLVMANVPSSSILVTLMMEGLSSSETSVLTRATWHNIPEDGIIHSHSHENLKFYALSCYPNYLLCLCMLNVVYTQINTNQVMNPLLLTEGAIFHVIQTS
jgi:hypothetical protein